MEGLNIKMRNDKFGVETYRGKKQDKIQQNDGYAAR